MNGNGKRTTHEMNAKEKRQFISRISEIMQAQKFVAENLIGKIRYFFYQEDRQVKWLAVQFGEKNFMHLCGITYIGGPRRFWQAVQSNQLSLKLVRVKNDGTTFQKLQVITLLEELNGTDLLVTSAGILLKMRYDHLLRTKKSLMGVALSRGGNYYRPLSLLNLRIKSQKFNTNATHLFHVIAIVDSPIGSNQYVQMLPEPKQRDFCQYLRH